ncbi:zinc finger protein 58-like [Pieris rapae]|uniref:zinc finger protein 58-like n=1 Tax=Pieris rapae TaxID=64459 RepID=UPI001E280135|nr:zinc finger protein 58-like [Pieris rapae]
MEEQMPIYPPGVSFDQKYTEHYEQALKMEEPQYIQDPKSYNPKPFEALPEPSQVEPKLEPEPGKPIRFISVNSSQLTDEQRAMYESVLSTWKPVMFPKQVKRYICEKCNKEFKNYQNLYLHTTRVHSTEESAVLCNICDKSFKNKHYLYMHRMNKHYSESEKCFCQFCLQEFRTRRALHMHVKRFHPNTLPELKCPECGKEFRVPYKLRYHIDACHRPDNEKYKCHICQKLYKSHLNLNRHLHFQHSQVPRHPCVFCDMTFKSRHHMKRHILNIHPPLESKVQCPECLKEFKNDQYLKEHMQVHSSLDSKVKCDLCDKFFHSAIRLKKHKKIVHPDKPKLRCEKCDKEFAHAHYLRRHHNSVHMEVDESQYEHECDQCGKKFKIKRYLNNHLQRHEQQHLKRISQMVKTVMDDGTEKKATKRGRPKRTRKEIEFVKCEPVSSEEETGSEDSESE